MKPIAFLALLTALAIGATSPTSSSPSSVPSQDDHVVREEGPTDSETTPDNDGSATEDANAEDSTEPAGIPEEENEPGAVGEDMEDPDSKKADREDADNGADAAAADQPSKEPLPALGNFKGAKPLATGTTRLGGSDRYETAVAISRQLFPVPTGSPVFLSAGTAYADGLSISALAAYSGGSLLLTQRNSVPAAVQAEIRRLKPKAIYVAGGPGVVSEAVVKRLEELSPSVVRIFGDDRYETSLEIARMFPAGSPALVATGTDFPDALVAATAAAKVGDGGPVLLSPGFRAGPSVVAAIDHLKPSAVTIIGGTWSGADRKALADVDGRPATVVSGKDRYATSAAVASQFWSGGPTRILYATGRTYADAMTGAPAAKAYDAPILLTQNRCRSTEVTKVARNQAQVLILGGSGAVQTSAVTATCPVLPAVVSQRAGFYRFDMTHRAQQNGYYCGPATGEMILSRLGYSKSVSGYGLSQANLARYEFLRTDYNRRTLYEDAQMSVGLNAWMGKNAYARVWTPSTAVFRQSVSNSFTSTGRPVIVDTQEYAGGAHYNGHPAFTTISHLMPVEGFNPSSGQIIMHDSASHFYGPSQPTFTHSLSDFTKFLQRYGIYR